MALARLNRKAESTEGKGNCAFNAFALALCDAHVFTQIEQSVRAAHLTPDQRFAGFIRRVAEKLSIPSDWLSVKRALLQLRVQDTRELQFILGPILRELSSKIALDPVDNHYHRAQTVVPLMSAFKDFRRKRNHKPVNESEDIFSRHRFVMDKFDDVLRSKNDKLLQEKEIDNWWWHEGYLHFVQEMSEDGAWAGDLELARLARYFNVVLDVVRGEFAANIHGNYGSFPFLHGEVAQAIPKDKIGEIMQCLYDRDVIKRDVRSSSNDKSIDFNVPELNILIRRLDQIPEYSQVLAFVELYFTALKGQQVPASWSPSCMHELIQRNVIGRSPDGKCHLFSVDAGQAMSSINKIPCYREVIKICREHYQRLPLLVLHHIDSEHWENTIAVLTPEETRQRRIGMFYPLSEPIESVGQIALRLATSSLRRSDEDVVRRKT